MDIKGIDNRSTFETVRGQRTDISDDNFETKLQRAVENKDQQKLKEACREFEGMLLGIMYKQMRATVFKSDLIPSDYGREIFEEMLDEEITKEASKGVNLGLADELYRQLERNLT